MSTDRPTETQGGGRGALLTGGLAAILASTCCLGPLVLITLGVSGAWISNLTLLEPYQPLFIVCVRQTHLARRTERCQAAATGAVHRCGSNSSIRFAGCVGSRSSTSFR